MKQIYLNKAFVVGALAALVFGAAAATLVTSSQEKTDDSPLQVPVGRVGDHVVYSFFAGAPGAENAWIAYGAERLGPIVLSGGAGPSSAPLALTPDGPRAFEVTRVDALHDAAHARHDCLVVVFNGTLAADPQFPHTVAECVDLDQRVVFRTDENAAFGAQGRTATPVAKGDVQTRSFDLRDPTLPGLPYQGLELRMGRVLQDRDLAAPSGYGDVVRSVHEKEWVVDRAKIDAVDAYAVRNEVTYRALVSGGAASGAPPATGDAPSGQRVELQVRAWRTAWMSGSQAYAVLQETGLEVMRDGQWVDVPTSHVAYKLQRVDAGTTFVQWHARTAASWATTRTDLERTSGEQRYPADGSGSTLVYPLGEAVRKVLEDPTLLQFTLYRQSHPDAHLIAARYGVSGSSPASPTLATVRWDLVFATTNGEAWEVTAERTPGTSADRTSDVGTRTVSSFSVDAFPAHPPTLAALERTWSEEVSEAARAAGFNYVRWGADLSSPSTPCPSKAVSPSVAPGRLVVNLLEGGHSDQGVCPGADRGATSSQITIDVETGLTVSSYEARFRYPFTSTNLAFTDAMRRIWTRAPSTVPGEVRPPEPAATASSSAGALALFVAVYFWPVVKFGLAKLVFVGGYAKISKADILNNPTREAMLVLIRNNPGIHASDLARQVNAGWGTIVYHLSVLQRNKVITSLVDGRHKRFFPADTVDFGKRGQLAALMNPNTKTIYELIEGAPGIAQGDLAGRTGLTVPTIIWHLQRLEGAGLVGRDREGRKFHYFANPVYQPKTPTQGESMEVQ